MTTFFEHQRSSFKRSYLRNLISLASADGHLDESERTVLYVIGRKRGLKDWQIEEEISNENRPQEIFIPESFMNRMNVLYDLMQILYADGQVDAKEIEFIHATLNAFKLSQEIAGELIRLFSLGIPSNEEWRDFTEMLQPAEGLYA